MRLIALVTLVIFLPTLTGCAGDTTSEKIEGITSEIESNNERVEDTTLIGKKNARNGEAHGSRNQTGVENRIAP